MKQSEVIPIANTSHLSKNALLAKERRRDTSSVWKAAQAAADAYRRQNRTRQDKGREECSCFGERSPIGRVERLVPIAGWFFWG